MNPIKIFLFATLAETIGSRSILVELPKDQTVAGLKDFLVKNYPKLSPARNSMLVAVNREYAGDDLVIPAGAEVALFPPVSGG
jgi:molybdopterin converting factor subunit 1